MTAERDTHDAPPAPPVDIIAEMIARLTRDADAFADLEYNSVSDARIRAYACKLHSRALARLLSDARDLASAGHPDRALALLRGDMCRLEPMRST